MPLFNLKCPNGHTRSILTIQSNFDKIPVEKKKCKECSEIMTRNASGPTAAVKEKLDNGVMIRAVERLADAEKLYHDRAINADPNAGRKNRS